MGLDATKGTSFRMSNSTTTLLKSCAQDLVQVRAQLPNNLEPRVSALFDSVVRRLKQAEGLNDRVAMAKLIDDGLKLVGRVAQAASLVSEIVDRLHH